MRLTKLIVLFSALLIIYACTKEYNINISDEVVKNTTPQNEKVEEYTGQNIKVTYDIHLPTSNTIQKRNTATTDTRSFTISADGSFEYDYGNLPKIIVNMCLQKGDDISTRSYKSTLGTIYQENGIYKVKLLDDNFRLKQGNLDGDGWKVCALLENESIKTTIFNYNKYSSSFNTNQYFDPNGTFNQLSFKNMNVPLYSSFRPIKQASNGDILIPLEFEPLGCILKIKVTNTLYTNLYLTALKMKNTSIYVGDCSMTLGVENDKHLPAIEFNKESLNSGWARWGFKNNAVLPSDSTLDAKYSTFYFWGIPNNIPANEDEWNAVFKTLDQADADKDSITFKQKLPGDKILENGKIYSDEIRMPESDLMITEYLHYNPDSWNYSMIELFNPTNHDIDLNNYAIARANCARQQKPQFLWKLVGYFDYVDISEAKLQTIYPYNDNLPIMLGSGAPTANPSEVNEHLNRCFVMYHPQNSEYVSNFKAGKENMLPPGKCVVLWSGGTYKELAVKSYPNVNMLPCGGAIFNSPYLANAVNLGYCHYSIAVDNGYYQNGYANSGIYGYWSGTMQGVSRSVFVVTKRDAPGDPYKPIDYLFEVNDYDKWNTFMYNRLPADSFSTEGNYIWGARNSAVLYPTTMRIDQHYLSVNNNHLPVAGALLWPGDVYRYYDWNFFFSRVPSESSFKYLVCPGTRDFSTRVYNYGYPFLTTMNAKGTNKYGIWN